MGYQSGVQLPVQKTYLSIYLYISGLSLNMVNPFNSGLSARVPERQKNKIGGLDQYGFQHFVV